MLYFDWNDKGAESKEAQIFYRGFALTKEAQTTEVQGFLLLFRQHLDVVKIKL